MLTCLDRLFKKQPQVCKLETSVALKTNLFAKTVSLQPFVLCITGRAGIYVRDAGPV